MLLLLLLLLQSGAHGGGQRQNAPDSQTGSSSLHRCPRGLSSNGDRMWVRKSRGRQQVESFQLSTRRSGSQASEYGD